ncbi:MAG: phage Gp37/Gp68 family protein [Bryobacterales bacterium]|nr:phage Gp37/Gp68 family protein [Bryobacterales bacterium]
MTQASRIEWTERTWNPVTGCTKISEGCKHCYAERMSRRLRLMGLQKYKREFQLAVHPATLVDPFKWKKPSLVFVNSMSDLFHKRVPDHFILSVFDTMNRTDRHTYQILTKRPERAVSLDPELHWTSNIWLGTSIESERWLQRADILRGSSASVKFLSLEPLLGPLSGLSLDGIDWVIVGGESGPGARPMNPDWVREIRSNCIENGVPFFFKQWGGVNKKRSGRLLDGRTWDELPPRNVYGE